MTKSQFPAWQLKAYPITETEAKTIGLLIGGAVIMFCLATIIGIALLFGGREFSALAVPGGIAVVSGIHSLVEIRRIWSRAKAETTFLPEAPE